MRVAPWSNSSGGMRCTRAPRDAASSALPSAEPESTTTTSTASAASWAAMPSRQRARSVPPFLTGMTIEITRGATVPVVIWAVVVTRDRRDLLEECLHALTAQTRRPDHLLVVDNASSDGTPELLAGKYPNVEVLELGENRGGAGGFAAGLERAHAGGASFAWIMDDDTIPEVRALEELLAAAEADVDPPPLLLSSVARWSDGRLHPMNLPGIERERFGDFARAAEQGLLPLRVTTFVSLLVARAAVDRFGLPDAEFFLWSDDLDYTARVTRGGGGAIWCPRASCTTRPPGPTPP